MNYCDDIEMAVACKETNRRARKPHVCGDCRGAIARGETYIDISGIWSDGPASYKRCSDCQHIRCELNRSGLLDGGCGGIAFDGLADELFQIEPYRKDLAETEWDRIVAMFNVAAAARGSKRRVEAYELKRFREKLAEQKP